MAYVYRKTRDVQSRGDRARWFVGYKDEGGRYVQVATRARTKREAEKFAQELEHRAERIRCGLEAAPPAQLLYSELSARYERDVAKLKRGYEGTTKYRLARLAKHFGPMRIGQIDAGAAQKFVAQLDREGLGPNTIKALIGTLQGVFTAAIEWGLASKNPAHGLTLPEVPEREPRYMELEEIARLLAKVPHFWRPITATALLTGLRTGELAGLRRTSVSLARRTIRVTHSYDQPIPKGGRTRPVPIPEQLVPFLEEALARATTTDRLFVAEKGGPIIRTNGLARRLREWAAAAGVEITDAEGRQLQFRHLRSTYGTHAAEQLGMRFAQLALGHADLELTEKTYAAARRSHIAAQARGLNLLTDPARTGATEAPPRKEQKSQ